ncbi:restriction endonuclease subunit S [Rhizobium sp. CSW-27]|uniref:restriction endonuclease subunit S n=1 Tax=Rhizobium sp. CSW-27 TaxID=2839985 RepID=UPI001C038217|nr:restriction endonuclease subunit S [Rhizobium sp. CSW-27]MBT9373327.1 restriction endonuclease subunit S [Rhizobium sp. CSW-27]
MNAERLLQHYEQIADAPDAIARLRRFILDLAVRGKLVPQDSTDEPASQLLKQIATERARLEKAGAIRKAAADLVQDEEAPFHVPQTWVWTRLGAIADWGAGSTPPRGNSDFYGGDIPWLKSGELNDNRKLAGSEETVTQLALEKCSFRINMPGDVLLAMYGATIGKVAILAEQAVTNQAVCGCTPLSGVFNQFLFVFLLSRREQFHSASEGGAQPNISKIKIVWTPFPLPPLTEQHRIVAKVDELMALCDELETARTERETKRDRLAAASLARLNTPDPETFRDDARFALDALPALTDRPDQIKQLRQTILNLAVRGKLVPQDPADEPAVELLARVAHEIAVYGKQNRVPKAQVDPILDDDVPFSVPNNWQWVRLAELFNVITDGDHQPPPKAEKGVAFLTIGNVTTGRLDFTGCRLVPEEYFNGLAPYRTPTKGDILYTVVGATFGRPALVESDRAFCVQRHIAILKPAKFLNLKFLVSLLASPLVYDQAARSTTGTAQPTIALRPLRNFLVPLPPLAEQHRIVAKVDELMALCGQLETSLTSADETRKKLLDALLAEALAPVEVDALQEAAE